jgi:hypothetical protein
VVGGDRTAVAHAGEALEEAIDDRPGGTTACIGEKADAARTAFAAQVVERRLHVCALLRVWTLRLLLRPSRRRRRNETPASA